MNRAERVFCAWRRNLDVYLLTWRVSLLPPLVEPLLYLLAFGAGLGGYVRGLDYRGELVDYRAYIAPGVVATNIMFQSFFECSYGSFVRIYHQKTVEVMAATLLSVEDIILGEIFWGATRAVFSSTIMCVVIHAFGLMRFPDLLALPVIALLGGVLFACLAMCFTSAARNADSFNYPIFLIITPMFLFSGTFFPTDALPAWGQVVANLLPLTHLSFVTRSIAFGCWDAGVLIRVVGIALAGVPAAFVAVHLMRRRLVE